MVFSIPNFIIFLNESSNDLHQLKMKLINFRNNFYLTTKQYFYTNSRIDNIIIKLKNGGHLNNVLDSLIVDVDYAINNNKDVVFTYHPIETSWDWDDAPEDIPLAKYADPLNPVPFPDSDWGIRGFNDGQEVGWELWVNLCPPDEQN